MPTAGLIDSSGVRYFYTDEPPEMRAGILPIGHHITGHMIIPPGVERYTVTSYCPLNCTNAVSYEVLCTRLLKKLKIQKEVGIEAIKSNETSSCSYMC